MVRKMQFLCGRKQQDKKNISHSLKKKERERERDSRNVFFLLADNDA